VKLSVVTTLYQSAPHLEEFHARVSAAVRKITPEYEIILVNDGSPDASLDLALALYERDERTRVVDLSRNFGHYKAIMTGLARTEGDLVFLIDCDLEEQPELISEFHEKMMDTGADVVYGVQAKRRGGLIERISGSLFYSLFNLLSAWQVPRNLVTARLMSRRYVRALVQHRDREVFLAGLWAITGFTQVPVTVRKLATSKSTYCFARKAAVLADAISSFSSKPLIYVFYLGFLISALAGTAALWLVIRRLFFNTMVLGWPSLIVSIWLLGGLSICCTGILGIYLSKVFLEVKNRPYTIVREEYRHRGPAKTRAETGERPIRVISRQV